MLTRLQVVNFRRFSEIDIELGSPGAVALMEECIRAFVPPVALNNMADPWWSRTKMSDEFLDRLFEMFYQRMNLPNLMRKSGYHLLAPHLAA